MKGLLEQPRLMRVILLGLALTGVFAISGCQVDVGGQTLPSPYYLSDDVQYFPPGPEFKLAREAAALEEFSQEQALQR